MENNNLPTLNMVVSDLLNAWPQVIPVFIQHKMACVGCSMASFETLGSAAKIYGIAPESFVNELRRIIQSTDSLAK
jgi:hybrid cluster-associated redox disulfide protein